VVSVAAGHAWLPGTPNRWHWDGGAFQEIFHFGKWIFSSSILGFLATSSDRLMLGTLVDTATFGFYSIAILRVSALDQMLGRLSGGVAFSALSEVIRRSGDLRAAYYRLHAAIAAIAFGSVGFLMVAAQPLVAVIYDHRYADVGWMLQIVAAFLLTRPFSLGTEAYLALGMPHLLSRILITRLVVLCTVIPAGFFLFGFIGALWGSVLSQFSSVPMLLLYNMRNGIFDLPREISRLLAIPVGMTLGGLVLLAWGGP
jgi:O-antigen/teichoic acid export membrane protein